MKGKLKQPTKNIKKHSAKKRYNDMPQWCSSANHCGLSHEKVRVTKQENPQTRVQIPVEAPNFSIIFKSLGLQSKQGHPRINLKNNNY